MKNARRVALRFDEIPSRRELFIHGHAQTLRELAHGGTRLFSQGIAG